MLYDQDKIVKADKTQGRSHIFYDHDYKDKLRAARLVGIVEEDEKRGAGGWQIILLLCHYWRISNNHAKSQLQTMYGR
jgi:hypothetical protein